MTGDVYWITGLSGSGKTTIGTRLYYYLKATESQIVLLDGDVIKRLFGPEGIGYSHESRKRRAFQYAELCRLLSAQGITVICCTISMFNEVRQWNRTNIQKYHEIFIDVDLNVLIQRDPKGLYSAFETEMVGMSGNIEFPKNPDVIINNTMDNKVDSYIDEIISQSHSESLPFCNATLYWDAYYKGDSVSSNPSDFARFALKHMECGKKLIDLGCGNGRDSTFFCKNGVKVTAVDLSKEAILSINQKALPIFAVCDDFVMAKALFCVDYDYCYARWSIHAINSDQQYELISNVSGSLQKGGLFFIEARTVNDAKYGLGKKIGEDEYIHDGHYRRFIRANDLIEQLEQMNFNVIYKEESDAFSVVGNDAPTLIRAIAKKQR